MEAFGRLLRVPHVRWLFATALLGRLPYGIEGLSTVLFVQEEKDSFAAAGIVSAAFAVAAGAGLPVLGRVIDVLGQTRVLILASLAHAGAGAALIALGLAGAPTGALAVTAAVAGFFVPPISPALRGLWPDVLGDDATMLRTALAFDAITIEFVWIGGPLITAVVIALSGPAAALAFGLAVSTAGALAFALSVPSRRWRGSGDAHFGLGPLTSPGMRAMLAASIPIGFMLGTLEVSLPAFGIEEGSRSLGALGIAALSVGSAFGGVFYGARPPQRVILPYLVFAAALPFGVALLALPASLLAMLLLAPLAGAVLAPLTAVQNELIGRVAPSGTVTEAYAWLITGTIVGVAVGTAIAGAVIEASGWSDAVALGAGVGLLGTVIAFTWRTTLEPAR